MGIYLSSPKTEKFSEDGENDRLRYGLSSMQGWRATMEDAVSNKGDLLSFWIIQIYVFSYSKLFFMWCCCIWGLLIVTDFYSFGSCTACCIS